MKEYHITLMEEEVESLKAGNNISVFENENVLIFVRFPKKNEIAGVIIK